MSTTAVPARPSRGDELDLRIDSLANGGAGALQNMHLHAGLANGGFCEWHLPFMGLCRRIYKNMPDARDGKVAIPAGPGLGFEPDRDAVRDITVKA